MSSEKCVRCGLESTPWEYLENCGHICLDCSMKRRKDMGNSCKKWWDSKVQASWNAIGVKERGLDSTLPAYAQEIWNASREQMWKELYRQYGVMTRESFGPEDNIETAFKLFANGILYTIAYKLDIESLKDKCDNLDNFIKELKELINEEHENVHSST